MCRMSHSEEGGCTKHGQLGTSPRSRTRTGPWRKAGPEQNVWEGCSGLTKQRESRPRLESRWGLRGEVELFQRRVIWWDAAEEG